MKILNTAAAIVALIMMFEELYQLGTMFLLFNILNNIVYYGEHYLKNTKNRNIVEIRHKKLKFEDDYNDAN